MQYLVYAKDDIKWGQHWHILAINKETGTYHRLIDSVNTVVASEAADNSLLLENKIDSKSISMRDYDSILGLSGILRYLLLTDSELYRESIQKVVDALIYLSQYSTDKQEAVPNWHIQKDNVFPYEERESYRSGMINFGLSHGIAGPLAVLSVAKLQGINRPGLAEAIGRLIEFFLCFVQEQPDGEVYWPSAITGEEYLKPALSISPHKRLSWCYGSLSILRSLFLASKAVSNEKIQIWAVNKAIRFTKMSLEKYLFESPTICHGYSGALILFESFYRDTHETAFLDAIERLQRKICSMNSMSYKYGFQNIDWIKGKYNIEDDLSLDESYRVLEDKRECSSTSLVLKPTKTKKSKRIIFMTGPLKKELKSWIARLEREKKNAGESYRNSGMLFRLPNGTAVESTFLRKRFEKWQEEHPGYEKIVFHGLRHSSATYQLEVSGGDIKAVQGNTGHAQAGILVNTYAHIQDQARIELAARIERDFYPAEEKETPVHNPTIRTEKMSFSDILELIQQADPAQKKQLTLALLA